MDSPVATIVRDIVLSHAEGIDVGARAVEMKIHPALDVLRREFDAALKDPQAKIPTRLELAILAAVALLPLPPEKPEWIGRGDHDMNTRGGRLEPGS